jgi:hypothetical protein
MNSIGQNKNNRKTASQVTKPLFLGVWGKGRFWFWWWIEKIILNGSVKGLDFMKELVLSLEPYKFKYPKEMIR